MRKLFLISFICLFAKAWAYDAQINGIYYNLNESAKTASVTSGDNKYSGEVNIPATVSYSGSTYDVTSIESGGFFLCYDLTKVVIPESVSDIGFSAFSNCDNLTEVNIPNAVKFIKGQTFEGCRSLTSMVIPDNVSTIGYEAFAGCSSLRTINIPTSVDMIDDRAFQSCSSLTAIELSNVTWIGVSAFSGCSSLTIMTIPNGVSSIKESTFAGCDNLTTINIPNSVESIGASAFWGCSSLTAIELPRNITSIEDYTFHGCSSLKTISIPEFVESIGQSAFQDCSNLTNVDIPCGTSSIAEGVFGGCDNLLSINVDENNWYYTSVDGVLYNKEMSSLLAYPAGKENTSFAIPNSVTTIEFCAFHSCRNLVNIDIPSSVTAIGSQAFRGCENLTSIDIPNSVKSIDGYALGFCRSLSSINVLAGNTEYASADGILYSKDMSALLAYPAGKKNTSYTIPSHVTTIAGNAFSGCNNLTRIDIPATATNFEGFAFYLCDNIKSVYIYNDKDVLLVDGSSCPFYFTYDSGIEHDLYVRKGMKEQYETSVYQYIFTRIEEMTDEEAGINDVNNGIKNAEIKHIYDINGRKQNGMQNGVNIIRYSDGSVRKVVKK